MLKSELNVDGLLNEYLDPQKGLGGIKELFTQIEKLRQELVQDKLQYTAMISETNSARQKAEEVIQQYNERAANHEAKVNALVRERDEQLNSLKEELKREHDARIVEAERLRRDLQLAEERSTTRHSQTDHELKRMEKEKAGGEAVRKAFKLVTDKFFLGKKKLENQIKILGI